MTGCVLHYVIFCPILSSSYHRRLGGASTVYPTPRNREIGFVSSSFSFRAVRAVRAGEAKLCGRMGTMILIAGPPGC